jgi:hypothetical protein
MGGTTKREGCRGAASAHRAADAQRPMEVTRGQQKRIPGTFEGGKGSEPSRGGGGTTITRERETGRESERAACDTRNSTACHSQRAVDRLLDRLSRRWSAAVRNPSRKILAGRFG